MKSADIEPFIRHIRFPFFKNLTVGCKVDFNYPITAFVGQNGTNRIFSHTDVYGRLSWDKPAINQPVV